MTGIRLPELRVVPMADVLLHEGADERRVAALTQRLQAEGLVKNPPIVSLLEPGRYVVLDGANRVSALRRLGVPDLVVQVVDYAEVTLSTWYHLVTGIDGERLLAAMRAIAGLALRPASVEEARRELAAGTTLAFLATPGGPVYSLAGGDGLAARTALLREAVAAYKGRANIHRVQSDDLGSLAPFYDEIAALVVFPAYQARDILAMARADAKLPTGITRHLIPMRALRTNIELAFLWSDIHPAEKNRWLAEWTRHKLQQREIRIYEETTVLFDE